ncbi:hypothetical protein DD238_008417 [Peronospora effusa]|uniref:Uncharacterized protein n=1 Tax=Peronospora effusa TaxID=542832 RepID=A0A3M6VDM6_9STRA|nr:hypothetical protein DD238_008417 [Peronospora effusa]RQM12075.1 hypothetical protein DD237_004922 [Peronospora effusa]
MNVAVWYQIASTAVKSSKLLLARKLLEKQIFVDAKYCPLVETLALVLHHVKDKDEYEFAAKYLAE